MKQIPKFQIVILSILTAILFWFLTIFKNNIKNNQIAIDFQNYWIAFSLILLILIFWITYFHFLYAFVNFKIWVGKIFVYFIGLFLSLFIADSSLTPFFYYLESVKLLKNSALLGAMHHAIHHDLFLCLSLVFIIHDFLLIKINKSIKLSLLKCWIAFMLFFTSYFIFGRYSHYFY